MRTHARCYAPLLLLLAPLAPAVLRADAAQPAYVIEARGLAESNPGAAAARLKQGLSQDPDNAAARLLLGRLSLRTRDFAAAQKELERAQALGIPRSAILAPLAEALLGQEHGADLLEQVRAEEAATPAEQARVHLFRGRAEVLAGRPEAAAQEYRAGLEADPRQGELFAEQARLALGRGDAAAAGTIIDQGLAAAPGEPTLWLVRAQTQAFTRRYADAVDSLHTALRADPHQPLAQLELARALARLGRLDEALAAVQPLRRDLPTFVPALATEADLRYRQRDFIGARNALDELLRLEPGHTGGNLLMAMVAVRSGETGTAAARLDLVLAADPGNLAALRLRGALLLGEGRAQEVLSERSTDPAGAVGDTSREFDPILAALRARAALGTRDRGAAAKELSRVLRDPAAATLPGRDQALDLMKKDLLEEALTLVEQGLGNANLRGRALLQGALADLRDGRWDAALKKAETIEGQFPGEGAAWEVAGWAELGQGHAQQAADAFAYALKLRPDLAGAATALARLTAARDPAGARGLLTDAIHARPKFAAPRLALAQLAWAGGDQAAGLRVLQEAAQALPEDPQVLAALGEAQWSSGAYDASLMTLQRLVERLPQSAHARYLLSMPSVAKGERKTGETLLREARALDDAHLPAGLALGRLLIQDARAPEAAALVAQLRQGQPASADLEDLAAEAQQALGQAPQALAAAQRAYWLAPTRVRALRLTSGQWQAGQTAAAVATLASWVQTHPGDVPGQLALGEAQVRLGQREAARDTYLRVLESEPNSVPALNNLAMLALGQAAAPGSDQALDYARRALAAAPGQPQVVATLAAVLSALNRHDEALAVLRPAIAAAPQDPGLRLHLARALEGTGDLAAARAELQALLVPGQRFAERGEAEALLARLDQPQAPVSPPR